MANDLLTLTASVDIQAAAGAKKPKISIIAYNGGLMNVGGWGAIAIELSGLDIPASVPLLADHDQSLSGVVGSGTPRVDRGSLTVSGHLTDSEAGRGVLALARDDVPLQASVGVEPSQRRFIPAGESATVNGKTITAEEPGFTLLTSGALREISIVAVGADSSTSVSIAASQRGQVIMSTDTPTTPDTPQSDFDRVQAAWDSARWNYSDAAPYAHAHRAMVSAAAGRLDFGIFESELRQAQADDQELHRIRAERPQAPMIGGGPSSRDVPGGVSTKNILAAASLAYLGKDAIGEKAYGERTMQAARDLGLRSVYDLARYAMVQSHQDTPSGGEALLKAAFSSTNLPNALGDSAGKIARTAFAEQASTWRSWCDTVPVSDFKSKTLIRVAGTKGLDELGASGEIHHDVLTESTGTVQAATYAKMLAIPRKLLINDDLGLIPQVATEFGKMAARKVSNLVYTALLANAGSFFSEANGNLITDTLDADGLAAALLAFRSQTDEDSEPIDIPPKVLIVGPTLEPTARALLNSEALQRYVAEGTDNAPMGNPWSALNLTLEVEPRLEASGYTGYSTTQWYLAASPSAQAAVVAFLNGQQGATVESADTDFNTLGQQWRCYIDAGAALIENQAIVKSTGAG